MKTKTFQEYFYSLNQEEREKLLSLLWKHKPANWIEDPEWQSEVFEKIKDSLSNQL